MLAARAVEDEEVAADDDGCSDEGVGLDGLVPPEEVEGDDPEEGGVVDGGKG